MCIAIPSPGQQNAGTHLRWWRYLSSSPARLLGFSATLQLAALALNSVFFPPADPLAAISASILIALGTLLLGLSLTLIPQRLGALPLSYPLLVALFALVTIGGLLAVLSPWEWAGGALMLIGWLIALRTLWWKLKWAPGRLSQPFLHLFRLLTALVVVLGVILTGLHPFSEIFCGIGLVVIAAGTWSLAPWSTENPQQFGKIQ